MSREQDQTQVESNLDADIINLSGSEIGTVEAEMVRIHRGGARRVIANDVGLHSGGAGVIAAETVGLQMSAAVAVRADVISMDRSASAVAYGDTVRQSNSRTGVTIARQAQVDGGSSIFLLAGEVHGPVKTVFDTQDSVLVGLIAGLATGLMLLIGARWRR